MQVVNRHIITQTFGSTHGFLDGRPTFSPDGNKVLFERQKNPTDKAELWLIDLEAGTPEVCFYANPDYNCMRADWNRDLGNGQESIAFTATAGDHIRPKYRIMTLDPNSAVKDPVWLKVLNHELATLSYPVWYQGTNQLLLANYSNNHLIKANTMGEFLGSLTPDVFRSGMGCINPNQTDVIAFAGQPRTSGKYNQKINQIWIQLAESDPELFSSDASGAIGRAPWINPKGTIMAYEAYGTNKRLQIFLKLIALPYQVMPEVQVSMADLYAQHAKFSPDGKYLVWAEQTAKDCAQIVLATVIE